MGLVSDCCEPLVLQAPAKINLFLRVLARRSDGYHDLDTVMQKLDLCDRITLTRTNQPGIVLRCPGSDLPEDRSNIVFRAAEAFFLGRAAESQGLRIVLEKNIPVGAGLGGGSSDAGTVLAGMNRLYGAGLSVADLIALARPLGADVPFFVVEETAVRASGIGDRMVAVSPLRDCVVVLVNPGFSVATRSVYEKYALTREGKKFKLHDSQKKMEYEASGVGINDLEQVTVALYPEVKTLKQELLTLGAISVLMSGSGPTVFGIFPNENGGMSVRARQAVQELQRQGGGNNVFVTQPV